VSVRCAIANKLDDAFTALQRFGGKLGGAIVPDHRSTPSCADAEFM
jgi:hypothetical protein